MREAARRQQRPQKQGLPPLAAFLSTLGIPTYSRAKQSHISQIAGEMDPRIAIGLEQGVTLEPREVLRFWPEALVEPQHQQCLNPTCHPQ